MKQCTVLAIILLLIGAFLVPILSFEIKRSIDQGIGIHRNRIIQKEYHLYPTRVNWTEAGRLCVSRGMGLVSILSEKENNEIINAIKEAGHGHIGFWTSGNNLNTNTYFWLNGNQVIYSDWESGQPDRRFLDGEEEKCIEIKGFKTFKWNDNFCSHELFYICETN